MTIEMLTADVPVGIRNMLCLSQQEEENLAFMRRAREEFVENRLIRSVFDGVIDAFEALKFIGEVALEYIADVSQRDKIFKWVKNARKKVQDELYCRLDELRRMIASLRTAHQM